MGQLMQLIFLMMKHLYSAGYDGTIRLWNIIEGFEIRTLIDNGWGVNVLEIDEKKV